MSIIAKYKFDSSIYADLIPEFNAEFTDYTITDEAEGNIITRTIESDELPTLMRFGRVWVEGESTVDSRTDSLLEVLDMDTSGLTDCRSMFRYCTNLTSITCEWDTSNVTNMYAMFCDCYNLVSLDVSNLNTSEVTNMGAMFYNCHLLTTLDVSNFNTSKVTNMAYTFYNCIKLTTLDVSNFDTSNVTDMWAMFDSCHNLTTLDVSNFNTSNVTSMGRMFSVCEKLTTLDVSNFDTSKVTTIIYMFNKCYSLTSLDISNFDTSKVTTMEYVFYNTPPLTDIGMLYCNQSTINKIASLLPTDTTQTIWVEDVDIKDLTPVEGVEFKHYAKNTEVMLTSPLLEGDKIEVIDGKTYHYHKMGMVVLDGSEDEDWHLTDNEKSNTITFTLDESVDKEPSVDDMGRCSNCISNNYKSMFDASNIECFVLTTHVNRLHIAVNRSRLVSEDENGFKQWLQANPTTVVYELASPYYELISNEPLNIPIVSETADITNSSNIPINMIVNNSPLSTIAMNTSTEYTVAFDKSENTSVVVDLCGSSIETTDNVVHITTSNEMMGDRLTIYGNGEEISNVRVLEGNVSGDSIPRKSFKGLKNSFEDGYIPENLTNINEQLPFNVTFDYDTKARTILKITDFTFKPNTTYTIKIDGTNSSVGTFMAATDSGEGGGMNIYLSSLPLIAKITTNNKVGNLWVYWTTDCGSSRSCTIDSVSILEGDWTHLTEEDFNHLGKYKVEYKVTGKNLFDIEKVHESFTINGSTITTTTLAYNTSIFTNTVGLNTIQDVSKLPRLSKGIYTFSGVSSGENVVLMSVSDEGVPIRVLAIINTVLQNYQSFTLDKDSYIDIKFENARKEYNVSNLQMEEGAVATPYEPYKSYTKTFYLNSPLLEGDTIEDVNGVATHVKRCGMVVFDGSEDEGWRYDSGWKDFRCNELSINHVTTTGDANNALCDKLVFVNYATYLDTVEGSCILFNSSTCTIKNYNINQDTESFKKWLQASPLTVVHKLASPIYEPISTESILCDSYVNGHLDLDSAVPIERVEFNWSVIPLKYISSSTNYLLQFDADNDGIINWMQSTYANVLLNTNVVKGTNKLRFTARESSTQLNELWVGGIGFNASNIQVVATDKDVDFGYFKGLQSSFEEKIYNGDDNLFNKNSTIYEGLNEDITMKWFVIEKPEGYDCITIASKGETIKSLEFYESTKESSTTLYNWFNAKAISHISEYTYKFTTDNPYIIMAWNDTTYPLDSYFDRIVIEKGEKVTTDLDKIGKYKVECKVVGKNKFDINKAISIYINNEIVKEGNGYLFNGTVPVEVAKLDKNKTYTLSVGKAEWLEGQDCQFMIVDTNHKVIRYLNPVIHNKKPFTFTNASYLYITKGSGICRTYYENIQLEEGTVATPYEPYQEYTKTIHLNSPLLKGDTIEVHNGKLCHYHKMGMVVLDGSEVWTLDINKTTTNAYYTPSGNGKGASGTNYANILCDKLVSESGHNIYNTDIEGIAINGRNEFNISLDKSKVKDGIDKYLQANPITVVYELTEPYYEEISPLQEDLIITSVKEGDLHIDTIIPISSKVTYNVNVQLLTDFEQSIVEQVQATQTTDLQSILDEEIDN